MGVSKVEFGGDTLIDLTSDTVTPETLADGETAHNAAGEEITGTLKVQDEIVTTTGTGEIYEAAVRGITELKNGVSFVMIPHETNTNNFPKLNVNGLGEINIWRRTSTGGFISVSPNLLLTGVPYRVVFCENMLGSGSHIWELVDIPKPVADDLNGTVPVANGGVPFYLGQKKGNVLAIGDSGTPEWQEPTGGGSSDTDDSMVGTWVFNDVLNAPTEEITYQLQFISTTSNGIDNNYRNISVYKPYPTEDFFVLRYSRGTARYTDVYAFSDSAYQDYKPYWQNEEWKTIKITQEPEDGNTIAWIKANAQKAGQQQESDARLKTKSKRLVDAINEISDKIDEGGVTEPSPAIIDVVELPTENIDEDMFYRLLTGTFVLNQYVQNGLTVYCVDGLPEVGEPATNADMSEITAYYNAQDGEVYGYVDAVLSQFFGVPIGWYPASMLFQAAGEDYKGIITDILDDPMDGSFRILLEYVIYSYKDGKWTSNKTIGWSGEGAGAEVFNHPSNRAYGDASHAEGRGTHAEGYASHAEGEYSHAEGISSHAEGLYSHAEGDYSHAEGDSTIASGNASHAQGRYNIEDTENKYAHIVGNGTSDDNRSNAHTLDWNGVAWFAGDVKVGGTGQDDTNAKTLQTQTDDSLETEDKTIVGAINEVNRKTVDKVTYMETDPDRQSIGYSTSNGIYWKGERRFYDSDENELCQFAYDGTVPIVAGDNISIDLDETNKVFKINATGGGSSTPSVSLIGTWTVIDNPEIPTSDIPLEFTSNGTEYIGIGSTSMGSSSWGINALSYKSPEGYYEAAYVNNPSGGYGITHGWRNEAYRYLTVTKEPESREAIAWLGANTDAPKVELPKEEMPQIRFANFQDINGAMHLTEDNPFTFTVEVLGGGELQWGDLLQICVRRKYWYRTPTGDFKHKWKLRSVVQREITDEDFGKRFLSINVTLGDVESRGNWLFRNDRKPLNADGTIDTHSYMYFRIKRVTQYGSDGEECNAIFSNVEKVAKTYAPHIRHLTIK